MSWQDVFRRDLRSVYRSRLGYGVAVSFALLTAGLGALINYTSNPEYPPTTGNMVVIFGSVLSFLVPMLALLASYSAIVGERETGSVRFLLGLPNSRADAYVGKFLSRTVVVVGPMVGGVLLAGLLVVPVTEDPNYLPYVLLALLSAWYAVIFVGVGMAASVVSNTDSRAVALAVGVFAVLRAGWPALQWAGLRNLKNPRPKPEWYFWIGRINPINAYVRATETLADVDEHPLITVPLTKPKNPNPRFRTYTPEFARESAAGSFVVSAEFAFVVLVVATLVGPVIGYVYFQRRDVL